MKLARWIKGDLDRVYVNGLLSGYGDKAWFEKTADGNIDFRMKCAYIGFAEKEIYNDGPEPILMEALGISMKEAIALRWADLVARVA